jgi:hypothetical protein
MSKRKAPEVDDSDEGFDYTLGPPVDVRTQRQRREESLRRQWEAMNPKPATPKPEGSK